MNGPSLRVLIATTASLQLALAQQQDEPLAALRLALPEVVLADCDDSIDVADFGLGGGGVAALARTLREAWCGGRTACASSYRPSCIYASPRR